MISFAIFLISLTIGLFFFYHCYYKRRSLPPGPMPLPFVGNQLEIARNQPEDLLHVKWKNQYGPIYTIWQGDMPIVCISDYAKIIETFQKDGDTYAGRIFNEDFENILKGGVYGIVITEGDLWKEQRRFALHVLRDFGLGKNMMQDRVLEEVETIFEKVEKGTTSGAIDHNLAAHIDMGVGSIINNLLFGYRFYGEKEHEFYELKKAVSNFMQILGNMYSHMVMQKPNLFKNLPFFKDQLKKIVDVSQILFSYYEVRIDEHKAELDSNDCNDVATDFVGAFLREKAKKDELGEPHNHSRKQLIGCCFDLWAAGMETTSTTLAWGLTYLICYPDQAEKLYKELDTVIGTDRLVNLSDRPHLPYTNAVVNEVQRLSNIVTQNLLHKTTKDVTIDGYFLPKGTCIIPQISAVLYDEENFKEADKFNPDRFLDSNGQLQKCDQFIPFSIGKRQCLGESLAKMELFLFLANIFNKYKVTAGTKSPSLFRNSAGTVQCKPFTCRLEHRYGE